MNDNDLRALAAKLLKHYVADQNPVAEALVAQIPLNRLPAKVIPLITAEQRALLDMLGGEWADVHEGKNVALIAQGCGGCGGCGGGDGGGDGGGSDGGGSGGSDGGSEGGDAGAGAGADGAGQGADAGADAGQGSSDAGAGFGGLSGADAAGWGGFSASDVGAAQSDAQSTADAQDASMQANASISTADPSTMSQSMADMMAAAQNQDQNAPDPGISAATVGSLSDQNAQANATTDAVSAGLDANAQAASAANDAGSSFGLSDLFGISSAKAGEFNPANSGIAAIQDAARAAAAAGQYDQFVSNPNYAAAIDPALNSQLSAQSNTVNSQNVQTVQTSSPYGALSPISSASSATSPSNPYGSLNVGPSTLIDPTSTAGFSSPTSGFAGVGPGVGGFTVGGPMGIQGTVGPGAYTGYSPVGGQTSAPDTIAPTSLTIQGPSSQPSAPSYTGVSAIDDRINNAVNNPGQTAINLGVGLVPGLGIANSISGLVGGPTVGSAITGAFAPGSTSSTGSTAPSTGSMDGGGGSSTTIPPITLASAAPASLDASTASGAATPAISTPSADMSAIRQYLGLAGDPTKYGFGAEQQFYSTPAAANGGYFDATQYFADGGMVQPLSAPTIPLVSTQPTMAFTDGAGPVGSIAQPPGLSPNDSVGFDATTASPMAPSIAASVPTVQPGLATLAMPNTNANPSPSPIAQNPNVGYALGSSPLSNLAGS